jgi:hypothetical protein
MEDIILFVQKGSYSVEAEMSRAFALQVKDLTVKTIECEHETEPSTNIGGYPFLVYQSWFVPRWQILEFWLVLTKEPGEESCAHK